MEGQPARVCSSRCENCSLGVCSQGSVRRSTLQGGRQAERTEPFHGMPPGMDVTLPAPCLPSPPPHWRVERSLFPGMHQTIPPCHLSRFSILLANHGKFVGEKPQRSPLLHYRWKERANGVDRFLGKPSSDLGPPMVSEKKNFTRAQR